MTAVSSAAPHISVCHSSTVAALFEETASLGHLVVLLESRHISPNHALWVQSDGLGVLLDNTVELAVRLRVVEAVCLSRHPKNKPGVLQ